MQDKGGQRVVSLDRDVEEFLRGQIKALPSSGTFTTDIKSAWQVVDHMIRHHHCELKLDVFLGITGQHWVASFYSPKECRRYEASGASAPLAICRAAREAILNLPK